MEEERIDIESLFEPHEDPPAPKPKKRNFPKGIFVTLLIVGILASSVFAFVHLEDPPQDGVPQIKYTVLEKKPMYVLDNPPYLSEISSAYSWHLKDYSTEENRQANFWLRINAASKTINEDWSFSAQISSICSASVHSGHNDAHEAVTEMHSKDHAFAGWMVYGYLPRSAELELQLFDKNHTLRISDRLTVDPLIEKYHTLETATLLDYAVHLNSMVDLLAFSNIEMMYGNYLNLAGRYPALQELICRADLPQAVESYLRSETACKVTAQTIHAIYDWHLKDSTEFGTYISTERALELDTKSLVYYLTYHDGFQNYLNTIAMDPHGDLQQQYIRAKEFCPVLSVLEARSNTARELIPLYNDGLLARFLLAQPLFQAKMTDEDRALLEQQENQLTAFPEYDPPTAQLVENMLENKLLIGSPLASSHADPEDWYQQARQNYPILQQLETRLDAVNVMTEKIQALSDPDASLIKRSFLLTLRNLSVYKNRSEMFSYP